MSTASIVIKGGTNHTKMFVSRNKTRCGFISVVLGFFPICACVSRYLTVLVLNDPPAREAIKRGFGEMRFAGHLIGLLVEIATRGREDMQCQSAKSLERCVSDASSQIFIATPFLYVDLLFFFRACNLKFNKCTFIGARLLALL